MGNRFHLILRVCVAATLLLHGFLLEWLAGKNIVAVLLSPGGHTPGTALFIALFFIFIRCITIIVMPGIFLYELWFLVMELRERLSGTGQRLQ